MNSFAQILLVATSLSPVLIAVAISQYECGQLWNIWIWPLGIAFLMVVVCWALLKYMLKRAQSHMVSIHKFERKDHEVLTFLFIYLLPFIRSGCSAFAGEPLTTVYVLFIIILALVYARAFHFNPVMRLLFGYRFYAIQDGNGVSSLLISKKDLRQPGKECKTVELARNVYLHKGDPNA